MSLDPKSSNRPDLETSGIHRLRDLEARSGMDETTVFFGGLAALSAVVYIFMNAEVALPWVQALVTSQAMAVIEMGAGSGML